MELPDWSRISEEAATVLRFWFGDEREVGFPHFRNEWFRKRAETDAAVRERFLAIHERGARGELEHWRETLLGSLAYVVLFDQFPRNMFRDTAHAFAFDGLALAAAEEALIKGFDTRVPPPMRMFFYLPFEHSEALAYQERAVALFERMAHNEPSLADLPEYAKKHRDVIARFGRFPHRNRLLGRENTPEEEAFLKQPGSSF